jgi:beta-carotene 3-hydroxylase
MAMEGVSYLVHRFVYHGLLWRLHKSHHTPRKGAFELNDVFPVFFATLSIILMMYAISDDGRHEVFAISIGITVYGIIYFLIHDLYIHRRIPSLSLKIPILLAIKKAHTIHHRYGGEPYGLLLFFNLNDVRSQRISDEAEV